MPVERPCRICLSVGCPPGCPPHGARQHFQVWADSSQIGAAAGPAWELVLSAPLPHEWQPPSGWRDVDVFVAALPAGVSVAWRRLPRPG